MVPAKRPSTTSHDRALTTPQHSFRWESDRQVQLPGPLIVQPWRLALHAAKKHGCKPCAISGAGGEGLGRKGQA
jgi:hypothetical protein